MARPAADPHAAAYIRWTTARRRALVRHWPWVLAALGAAIVIGLVSPDRSKTDPPPQAAVAADTK